MTDADIRARAIQLYDGFTHEGRDRRTFMRDMVTLAGSTAAANALIAGIAASPVAAAVIDPGDDRLITRKGSYAIGGGAVMTGYFAKPKGTSGKLPGVMVVHENRGLNPHIEDVARRVALAGFFAVAPDFLSPAGGTPADQDAARTMIGALDLDATVNAAVATVKRLRGLKNGSGRVGTVGFCWGGAMVNRVAVAGGAALDAGVSYYGPAPAPEEADKVQAAMMIQLAGTDERVNTTGVPWGAALKRAGKTVETHIYPDVDHAFNNDTSAERYNAAAATLAWDRTIAFFKANLRA